MEPSLLPPDAFHFAETFFAVGNAHTLKEKKRKERKGKEKRGSPPTHLSFALEPQFFLAIRSENDVRCDPDIVNATWVQDGTRRRVGLLLTAIFSSP